jgi:hypothetical protein
MRHLKIYEDYGFETMPVETTPVHFEAESTDITQGDAYTEGNYFVNFENSEGMPTTIEIGGALEPEYTGGSMVSKMEMVPDSSSDGKQYSIIGYYEKSSDIPTGYDLKKVLIEEV